MASVTPMALARSLWRAQCSAHSPRQLRAAGLPDTLRTYDLRHSHASLLIDRGANVLAVAQRMDHSDPTVTLRVYGHLFDGVQEKLTEELDQLRRETERPVDAPVVSLDDRRRGA